MTYGKEGGALLRQAQELAFGSEIYGADVWGSPELRSSAGDAAKGAKIITPKEFSGSKYSSFSDSFQKSYGTQPDTYASYAYDMAMLSLVALKNNRRGDDALRDALRATVHDGVTGQTRFDSQGDVVGKGFERNIL